MSKKPQKPPAYFESIRLEAAQDWDYLIEKPRRAGPWRELFKQVQDHRQVVSELLQNAEDAGATEARIQIAENAFIFQHNGDDFTKAHFASLCSFCYSNKRVLHTIGFRGIGFKSTFSLGARVELFTPTLSVSFNAERFTEPCWIEDRPADDGLTTIRVAISSPSLREEMERDLRRWKENPLSLLFFKNIRRVRIGDEEIHWEERGPGPVGSSEKFALKSNPDKIFLKVRSESKPFPEEALEEIRQERGVPLNEDVDFPPCTVELVLGVEGPLFVVLPTGVETELPFASNAPFIQDPARSKIKEPSSSATNRWLLQRVGKLAAEAMTEWLADSEVSIADRAGAYGLMPDVNRDAPELEGKCGSIVELAFADAIEGSPILLAADGSLRDQKGAVRVPQKIHEIWPAEVVPEFIDADERPALCSAVSAKDVNKLLHWGLVDRLSDEDILKVLTRKQLPRPRDEERLLTLWQYVESKVPEREYSYSDMPPLNSLQVIPVQGKDFLHAAKRVVRLGQEDTSLPQKDWKFLKRWLPRIVDEKPLEYLAEQRQQVGSAKKIDSLVEAADRVLTDGKLDEPSEMGSILSQAATSFFNQEEVERKDAIRLAHIAANLGAGGDSLQFFTQDGHLRRSRPHNPVIADEQGVIEGIVPPEWAGQHLLHADYFGSFRSCKRAEWDKWVKSDRSSLGQFVPFEETTDSTYNVEPILERRKYLGWRTPKYKNPWFRIKDWAFEGDVREYWEDLEESQSSIWAQVVERVLEAPEWWYEDKLTARITEQASNGPHERLFISRGLAPDWIVQLREKPCLWATDGRCYKPADIFRRTPKTEELEGTEPFVRKDLDSERTETLLRLLGVCEAPTSAAGLVAKLEEFAQADPPPAGEVEKLYGKLDRLLHDGSSELAGEIREAFQNQKIILTEGGLWEDVHGVFLQADEEDAPGAELIRTALRGLRLWPRIGVAERPTVDKVIQWLSQRPSGEKCDPSEVKRIRAMIRKYPERIWQDCEHWLNLAEEWVPVGDLKYALTTQNPVDWKHLFPRFKQETADLRGVQSDIPQAAPFNRLLSLGAEIEARPEPGRTKPAERPSWIRALGQELQRVRLEDASEEEVENLRLTARRLAETVWKVTSRLAVTPYIDNEPAGESRNLMAAWAERTLYVADQPLPIIDKWAVQELSRLFPWQEVADAVKHCYDRKPEYIRDFMKANFELEPTAAPEPEDAEEPEASPPEPEPEDMEPIPPPAPLHVNEPPGRSKPRAGDTRPVAETGKYQLMRRFAESRGFRKESETSFRNDEGDVIARVSDGSLCPWREISDGEVKKYYWPDECCLETQPLQLDTALWNLLKDEPQRYSLVLTDTERRPKEFSGEKLLNMSGKGEIRIAPATYRLTCTQK